AGGIPGARDADAARMPSAERLAVRHRLRARLARGLLLARAASTRAAGGISRAGRAAFVPRPRCPDAPEGHRTEQRRGRRAAEHRRRLGRRSEPHVGALPGPRRPQVPRADAAPAALAVPLRTRERADVARSPVGETLLGRGDGRADLRRSPFGLTRSRAARRAHPPRRPRTAGSDRAVVVVDGGLTLT